MFYNFRKNKKAFTLVELIVVIAIIAILGAVVGVTVSTFVDRARKSAAKGPIDGLYTNYINKEDSQTIKDCLKELYPNDYTNFYYTSSVDISTVKTWGTVTFYYHDDNCGKFWGKLEIVSGQAKKPADATKMDSAPSGFTKVTA